MGLLRFRGGMYTLSWEMYRALAGQPYSGVDKLSDDALDAATTRQVLVEDTQGGVRFRQMAIGLADRFEQSNKRRERETFLRAMWQLYDDLFSKYAYHRDYSDTLVEFKNNLENFHA